MEVVSPFNLVLMTNQSVTITPDLLISLSKHRAIIPTFIKPSSHQSSAINKATYLAQFIRWCLFCCFSKHAVAACNQPLSMHVHAGTHSSSSLVRANTATVPRETAAPPWRTHWIFTLPILHFTLETNRHIQV